MHLCLINYKSVCYASTTQRYGVTNLHNCLHAFLFVFLFYMNVFFYFPSLLYFKNVLLRNFILKFEPQLFLVYFCLSTNATNAIFVHMKLWEKIALKSTNCIMLSFVIC